MKHSVGFVLGALVVAGCVSVGCSGTDANPGFGNGDYQPSGGDDPTSDGGTSSNSKGDGGSAKDGSSPSMPQPAPTHLMSGLSIDEVAIFQATKISVAKAGAAVTSPTPIVAGRDALIRLYVKPASGWSAKSVTAVLTLTTASGMALPQVTTTQTISVASTDAAPTSTFNFTVPGSSLPVGVKFSVAISDPSASETASGTTSTARFPGDGSVAVLGTQSSGAQLRVKLVPVEYAADGSNRMPDVSAAQIESYRQEMLAIYPAAKVEITVRAPFHWTTAISASGSGFNTILQAMVNLRQTDNAPDDVYYFGAFAPSASFNNYCGGGCVTGLSGVNTQEDDATGRASVGVGFGDDSSAVTMAHELGHAHGRSHAPCGGASGVDSHFPYATGGIGPWGYNIITKALINPAQGKDIMGYCQPEWISDYTYTALFNRMAFVNMAKDMVMQQLPAPTDYRFVDVAADGSLSFGQTTTLARAPSAEAHAVTYAAVDGTVLATATGHYYKYDHLPGGFMMIPEGPVNYATLSVQGLPARALTSVRRSY
ncbi:MAG: M66 family metalloprotease [Polyangiaceae bacterium]